MAFCTQKHSACSFSNSAYFAMNNMQNVSYIPQITNTGIAKPSTFYNKRLFKITPFGIILQISLDFITDRG